MLLSIKPPATYISTRGRTPTRGSPAHFIIYSAARAGALLFSALASRDHLKRGLRLDVGATWSRGSRGPRPEIGVRYYAVGGFRCN